MNELQGPQNDRHSEKPVVVTVNTGNAGGGLMNRIAGGFVMRMLFSFLIGNPALLIAPVIGVLGLLGYSVSKNGASMKTIGDRTKDMVSAAKNGVEEVKTAAEVKKLEIQLKIEQEREKLRLAAEKREEERKKKEELRQQEYAARQAEAKKKTDDAKVEAEKAAIARAEWQAEHGFNAQCPRCRTGLRIMDAKVGTIVHCGHCGAKFKGSMAKSLGAPPEGPQQHRAGMFGRRTL